MENKIQNFRDIFVWQKSHKLTLEIYKLTSFFPKAELFNLTSQIRRSATSIPSNIVEGFVRKGKTDSLRFYNIADASLAELKYQILLSHDLGYIGTSDYQALEKDMDEIGRMLNSWMLSHKK